MGRGQIQDAVKVQQLTAYVGQTSELRPLSILVARFFRLRRKFMSNSNHFMNSCGMDLDFSWRNGRLKMFLLRNRPLGLKMRV